MSIPKALTSLTDAFRGKRAVMAVAAPPSAAAAALPVGVASYPRECPNCSRYVPALHGYCPGCGYRMPAATRRL